MPAAKSSASKASAPRDTSDQDTEHLRAGIQSVEVGFELLNALSQAPGALMLRDLAAAGIEFKDLQTDQSSLEDIFVSLVNDRHDERQVTRTPA